MTDTGIDDLGIRNKLDLYPVLDLEPVDGVLSGDKGQIGVLPCQSMDTILVLRQAFA